MHNVDISGVYAAIVNPAVQDLLLGLVAAAGGWLAYLMQKYAPKFIPAWLEQKASADLNTALMNGVTIAMHQLDAWEKVHSDVTVKGAVTAWAAQYAVNHASGAVDKFGLNPEQLAIKALAFVPSPPTSKDTIGAIVNDKPAVSDK